MSSAEDKIRSMIESDEDMRSALKTVLKSANECVVRWRDVRDELTSEQWGRMIENDILVDADKYFRIKERKARIHIKSNDIKSSAIQSVLDSSKDGIIRWPDVRDEITSGQWGWMINKNILVDAGFKIEYSDIIRIVVEETAVERSEGSRSIESPKKERDIIGSNDFDGSKSSQKENAITDSDNILLSSGDEIWNFETEDKVRSSPVVTDGTVYIGSNDNNLYAVDAITGTQQWVFETSGEIRSSPTVANGMVYVGSHDNNLYAVDASTGTQQWVFETSGEIRSSPTVANGMIYVGSRDNNLYAVDAVDGDQQWCFETNRRIDSSPTVANGTVYVGNRGSILYAVDAITGEQQWISGINYFAALSPTAANGMVYVGSNDYNLYAVDAATGSEEWIFETSGQVVSSPTATNGRVYVGGGHNLYAVDAETGEQQWVFETSRMVRSSASVADGTVYAGSRDGYLYAIDTDTGSEEWAFKTKRAVESSPAVADGTVYVGSMDGKVYAVTTEQTVAADSVGEGVSADSAEDLREDEKTSTRVRRERDETPLDPLRGSGKAGTSNADFSYNDIQKEAVLGRGAADVYEASIPTREDLNRVVLKEPRFAGELDADTRASFLKEARYWAEVADHPHVADIVDWGESPHPWLIAEYLEGGNLSNRETDVDEALWICARIADALHEAHTLGLRHFDLKPENVLLRQVADNPWDVPKVSDWGLARFQLEHSGRLSSFTPRYGAPEQFLPERFDGPDNRTDLYQLGLLLYELTTGEHPFPSRSGTVLAEQLDEIPTPPTDLNKSLPARLNEIIERLLAPQPADRYDSAAVARNVIDRLRTGETVEEKALADRADLYASALEYARGESLRECQRWAKEIQKFVVNNPVDDTAYTDVQEDVESFVEEWFAGQEVVYGSDHPLIVGGDIDLAREKPNLHHDIADVAEAVRRLYLRAA